MRKTNKKLVLFLLLLAVVIGFLPVLTITAFAANAGSEAALVAAVNNGGDVKLTKDIALTDVLRIPKGVTVTLDLNGKTLDRGQLPRSPSMKAWTAVFTKKAAWR